MATTPEGKIKKALDRMLKEEGVWSFSPQAGPYGVSGIPDRIAIVCGMFVGIECKADAKCEITKLQSDRRDEIIAAGGKWFLVYDHITVEIVRDYIHESNNRGSRSTRTNSERSIIEKHPVRNSSSKAGAE